MDGKGRGGVLAVTSPEPVLSVVGPLGLAASLGSGLVIDMIGDLRLPRARTLADLIAEGPRLDEISPGRPGVAILGSGGVATGEAVEAAGMLATSWPGVVVRTEPGRWPGPTVPVVPLYPGLLARTSASASVWQPVGTGYGAPGPGPVMPHLAGRLVRALLAGRLPGRSRWIGAWRRVWELPWA